MFVRNRSNKWKLIRSLGFVVQLVVCLMFLGPYSAPGQEHKDKLDKKELKSLIATAKTPADHLRLAVHYRAEADEYLARQEEHEVDAKEYAAYPQKYSSKYPTPYQHCRDWAYNDGQSAKKATALAEMHEEMARAAK